MVTMVTVEQVKALLSKRESVNNNISRYNAQREMELKEDEKTITKVKELGYDTPEEFQEDVETQFELLKKEIEETEEILIRIQTKLQEANV